jgi:hypothetical protein
LIDLRFRSFLIVSLPFNPFVPCPDRTELGGDFFPPLPSIEDADGLAFAPRHPAALDDVDADADAELLVQHPLDVGTQVGCIHVLVGGLATNRELVQHAGTLDDELVVRGGRGNGEERMLDVRGIHVDAADDEHVVAAAA